MKKVIPIVIFVLLFGWALFEFFDFGDDNKGSSSAEDGKIMAIPDDEVNEDSNEIGLEVGQMAPDIELENLDGETMKLSDLRGQRVIVNFWATWCPPCRAEIPDFQKLYDNKDVEILAINLTDSEKSITDVESFVEDYEMTFPVLVDDEAETSTTYKVQAYPTSYMIDSAGRVQFLAMGAMNYDLMERQLEKMD